MTSEPKLQTSATTVSHSEVDDLLRLQAAYDQIMVGQAPDGLYSRIVDEIEWSTKSETLFREAIQMAFTLEAAKVAYKLAVLGHQQFPDSSWMKWAEHVFAPPRLLDKHVPPVPGLDDSTKWLQEHANEYRGMWVAVLDGTLVANAPSRKALFEELGDIGDNPHLVTARVLK